MEREKALKRINDIRKEACEEGIVNPSTGEPLTSSDYVPIKWSADLEQIAQTRAAEASVTQGHTRPNGTSCFSVTYNGTQSWGEVLAWNYSDMVTGVEQWYGEKEDWVNETGGVTGHYTQMIDPGHTYVGLGCFVPKAGGWTAVAGEYSYEPDMDTSKVGVSGAYKQIIEVPLSAVKASLKGAALKKGKKKTLTLQMIVTTENVYGGASEVEGLAYGTTKWKSSRPSVVKVTSKGVVKAKKKGKATITAIAANGKKAKCTITVK